MIVLEKRRSPSRAWALATPVLAVLATMIAGGLLFAALGKDPVVAIRTIFWDPLFGDFASYSRPQLLIKAGPLILIAIGLSFGFRAGIWNIGAEGQYVVGALTGAAVGLAVYPAESWMVATGGIDELGEPNRISLLFPLMVVAGALGGFLWAMIPALLKVRFGTNEILVSLMLVYVATNLLAWAALGPLQNPEGMGFPGSRNLSQWAASANPELIAGTGMHWGVVTAFVAVIAAYVLLARHSFGFNVRLAGQAPRAAAFAGVSPSRLVIVCMGISGALAGVAGLFEVTGPAGQISIDFNVGYGFTAIIVAFLGRLHPIGILLAGLLMALTYIGGEIAQLQLGLPAAAIQMFQGMLLFFLLAMDLLVQFRVRWKARPIEVPVTPVPRARPAGEAR
jgi:simple sugar transport system permease protein